ncbi:MAG TPA: hypothetical protein VMV34_08705 [Terriglobia bacterium]|nr:hypothetical protein [Terriglobia bacterium]
MKYSPYSQSLDEDSFPKKEPRRKPSLLKWLLTIGFCVFFVYRSTLPVLRLQSNPPPEFIDHSPNEGHNRKQPEKRLALAYWDVAVHSIQMKYPPKKSLPATPPPEFRIDSKLTELPDNLDADRAYYWHRLRNLWNEQRTWQVSYGWNTDWFTDYLGDAEQYASQSLQQFVQGVRYWRDELGQTSIS